MMTRLLPALVLILGASELFAAAPPPLLTAIQTRQWRQGRQLIFKGYDLANAGKIDEAINALDRGLALERAVFGSLKREMLGTLARQARLLVQRERFREAVEVCREVLDLRRRFYRPGDWRIRDAELDLADIRREAKRAPAQRARLRQVLAWAKQSAALREKGRWQESLAVAEKVLTGYRELKGEQHRQTADAWLDVGVLHLRLQRLAAAERALQQALKIRREVLGRRHPACATCLANLAQVDEEQGEYARALICYEQARDLLGATLGLTNRDYLINLNNLATLYQVIGEYARARVLLERILAIRKEVLGAKHLDHAYSLNNLANLCVQMDDGKSALALFEESLAVRQAALGNKHPDCALVLVNLAGLHRRQGALTRARPLLEKACAIYRSTLGETHPDSAFALSQMALLDVQQDDRRSAEAHLRQALIVYRGYLDATFSALSERQRLDRLAQVRASLDDYLSVTAGLNVRARRVHEQVLAWKGLVTLRQAEDRLAREEPALKPLLEELRSVRAGLARLTAQTPARAGQKAWLERFAALEQKKEAVLTRARELAVTVKRGEEAGLRGISKKAGVLPRNWRESKRSHPAWWAGFVLSGAIPNGDAASK
jgi:tetratricopeptide (TPR) repeat protein